MGLASRTSYVCRRRTSSVKNKITPPDFLIVWHLATNAPSPREIRPRPKRRGRVRVASHFSVARCEPALQYRTLLCSRNCITNTAQSQNASLIPRRPSHISQYLVKVTPTRYLCWLPDHFETLQVVGVTSSQFDAPRHPPVNPAAA